MIQKIINHIDRYTSVYSSGFFVAFLLIAGFKISAKRKQHIADFDALSDKVLRHILKAAIRVVYVREHYNVDKNWLTGYLDTYRYSIRKSEAESVGLASLYDNLFTDIDRYIETNCTHILIEMAEKIKPHTNMDPYNVDTGKTEEKFVSEHGITMNALKNDIEQRNVSTVLDKSDPDGAFKQIPFVPLTKFQYIKDLWLQKQN